MPHRRICLGAMPVPLTGLDMDDVTDIDLVLFMLCGLFATARRVAGVAGRRLQ
jgi:hypothetical protein